MLTSGYMQTLLHCLRKEIDQCMGITYVFHSTLYLQRAFLNRLNCYANIITETQNAFISGRCAENVKNCCPFHQI